MTSPGDDQSSGTMKLFPDLGLCICESMNKISLLFSFFFWYQEFTCFARSDWMGLSGGDQTCQKDFPLAKIIMAPPKIIFPRTKIIFPTAKSLAMKQAALWQESWDLATTSGWGVSQIMPMSLIFLFKSVLPEFIFPPAELKRHFVLRGNPYVL